MVKFFIKVAVCLILLFSLVVPVKRSNSLSTYVLNVTYVNGTTRNIILELPKNSSYYIDTYRGSYSLRITSKGNTIWGYKSIFPFAEGNIPGILYINSITER